MLIRNYFRSPSNTRQISQTELRFLHSYVNHLKLCLAGDHNELNASLEEIQSGISKILTTVTTKLDDASEEVTTTEDEVEAQEGVVNDAQTELNRAQTGFNNLPQAEQQAPGARDVVDRATARLANETRKLTEKQGLAQAAVERRDQLTELPEVKTLREVQAESDNLQTEMTNLRVERRNLQARGAPQAEIDTVNRNLLLKQIQLINLDGRLGIANRDADGAGQTNTTMMRDTKNLITGAQDREIAKVLVGAGARIEDMETHLVGQIQKQLKDVISLTRASRKPDNACIRYAATFSDQIGQLDNDADVNTRLSAEFLELDRPKHPVTNQKIGGQQLYDQAIRILNHDGTNNTSVTRKDKKLALAIVGGFCASQAVRNSNGGVAYQKANDLMGASGQLLFASLTLKEQSASVQESKTLLSGRATSVGMEKVSETIKALPDDATVEEVRNAFSKGVNLNVAKGIIQNSETVSSLFYKATTDRTYENDLTVAYGASRQGVFKESMVRAIETLKTRPDSEEVSAKSRTWRATSAVNDRRLNMNADHINSLLGLSDQARLNADTVLLDTLASASIAHNDLSIEADFVPRGSLLSHSDKFEQGATLGILKNHNLTGYSSLSKALIDVAIQIRPTVDGRIDTMSTRLQGNATVNNSDIQQLVKQIIVTTDAQAADRLNLKTLVDSANALGESDTPTNRRNFSETLQSVKTAWNPTPNEQQQPLEASNWRVEDQRSFVDKALKANPIKSIPLVNQIPGVSRFVAASSNIAKYLIIGSAGAAGGAVALGAGAAVVAGLVGGAVVAAPVVGAYQAMRRAT